MVEFPGFDQVPKTSRANLVYCCCISSLMLILITIWACPESLAPPTRPVAVVEVEFADGISPDAQLHEPVGILANQQQLTKPAAQRLVKPAVAADSAAASACAGRRIYMYELPTEFNLALLELCASKLVGWINFCAHVQNYGFGESVNSSEPLFVDDWYGTDAYMLEVIFHSRMLRYECLTDSPSDADAFFIPFYAGIHALPYLYTDKRMEWQGPELVAWLQENATDSWQRHGGRDHFLIAGRTAWDFSRSLEDDTGHWGTTLLVLPELANVTVFSLERRPWLSMDQAVPYPTGFHPSTATSLRRWTHEVRTSSREYLFAFSGALRPSMATSIRGLLYNQCINAKTRCSLLDCSKIKCSHNPIPIYKKLLHAEFCLQPRGDTATRRSVFDSIIAGCIPVFFHEDTAYTQYSWHLPKDPTTYSVFMSETGIKNGSILVEEVLGSYSQTRIKEMREELIRLIPGSLYRHPESTDPKLIDPEFCDAFDLSVKGMLNKVLSFKVHPHSSQLAS
ncbi:hypothetical protein BDL97_06G054100 [Sphagnum fallax]|jgi:hypothetical protein|nr:hypothetical protein BDL97_06G054100 [Sphagnum fallax]